MSHKLIWRQTSKCKSRSMYRNSSKSISQSARKNTAHLDNSIRKVVNDKSNLSHQHLVKGSTYAPQMKPDAIYLCLNKSM